eukprot:TRINITY_DN10965_c0_g2_i1.p1 TRINITY_DN10965_c0_g2~~TRINITY_DN10965_c0_g2_i1.p1  ORF type:complete len:236 (-),score=27.31 TRINITY_DN10965_c0_g2_i1:247-954(-)
MASSSSSSSSSSVSPFRVQLVSDVHVEFPRTTERLDPRTLQPQAPYLALLGDIGYPSKQEYKDLLLKASDDFKMVFIIAGNHEYYKGHYDSVKKQITDICAERDNLIYMDKRSMLVDGVRVLGCTLWSYVSDGNAKLVQKCLNDYHCIYVTGKDGEWEKLSVPDTVGWHQDEVAWLNAEIQLAKEKGERVVIFTHHAPSMKRTSDPQYVYNFTSSFLPGSMGSLRIKLSLLISST